MSVETFYLSVSWFVVLVFAVAGIHDALEEYKSEIYRKLQRLD
jgi:hypothetical protein